MTTEKILSVTALYRERFMIEGTPKQRMDPTKFFETSDQMLAHAHYLIDGVEKFAKDPEKEGKAGRHLGSLQTLLWVAKWYTLEELMQHNRR
jgi:hypothetical protein